MIVKVVFLCAWLAFAAFWCWLNLRDLKQGFTGHSGMRISKVESPRRFYWHIWFNVAFAVLISILAVWFVLRK